eukprot:scaffold1982_cov93-Amphora_coffeaeformis.AAC.18
MDRMAYSITAGPRPRHLASPADGRNECQASRAYTMSCISGRSPVSITGTNMFAKAYESNQCKKNIYFCLLVRLHDRHYENDCDK